MRYTRYAGIVFILLLFMYSYFYQDPQANGNSRLDLTFAIVQEGRLSIDSYVDHPGTATVDRSAFNGHYYSDKDIGTSLIATLFYAPLYLLMKLIHHQFTLMPVKYFLTVMVISLPSAFAGSLLYLVCEKMSGSRLRALLATLAVMLGTLVLPFSAIFFGHQLAAALCFTSFFFIFQLRLKPELRLRWGYSFLIGLLLGFTFLTEFTTAIIILPLCIYYLYVMRDLLSLRSARFTLLPFAAAALISLFILMTYNTLSFGSPFSIGYNNLDNAFKASMGKGLFGISLPRLEVLFYLTFHPAMGLFWQSPVLLMAVLGFYFVLRDPHYRPEGLVVLFAFVGYLLVISGYFWWWGGYSVGPRQLIPMLMFLAIPLVMLPRKLDLLVTVLLVISIGQMLIPTAGVTLVPDGYFQDNLHLKFWGYSTIYDYSLKRLQAGEFTYNLGSKLLHLKKWMIFLPNILAIIGVAAYFILTGRPHPAETKTLTAEPVSPP